MHFDFFYLVVALVFILMVTFLVAAHEYGHYLFARIFKMEVEEFAIGMGNPKWVYKRKNGTDYTLRPWPVGGFVRIKGMQPEEDGSETSVEGGFYSKSPFARLMVLLAGPVFSVVTGILILTFVYSTYGKIESNPTPIIGGLNKNGAAYRAGMRVDDRIVSIDGQPVNTFYDVIKKVRGHGGKPLTFVYERAGKKQPPLQITPELDPKPSPVIGPDLEPTGEMMIQGKLGTLWQMKKVQVGIGTAAVEAMELPVVALVKTAALFTKPSQLKNSVGGPVTMVTMTDEVVRTRQLEAVLTLCALISVSVGIFNLLPVVPLDGGQMVVAFAELLRGGRRLSFKVQNFIQGVGLTAIAMLILSVFWIDISRVIDNRNNPAKPVKIEGGQLK